ncbi:hypothetical protein ACFOHS_05375 [Jhaorihella thermophila]
MLVVLDLEGRFIDVRLIEQNEPIFVSGLGEAPFRQFLQQYGGLSISDSIVVGTPYGAGGGGSLVYLDGVTKATASVRIAHESIMAAALAVAREKDEGHQHHTARPPRPRTRRAADLGRSAGPRYRHAQGGHQCRYRRDVRRHALGGRRPRGQREPRRPLSGPVGGGCRPEIHCPRSSVRQRIQGVAGIS